MILGSVRFASHHIAAMKSTNSNESQFHIRLGPEREAP